MTKITFVMGQMGMGGAEQGIAFLAWQLRDRYDALSLVNLSSPARDFFDLPPQMPHHYLHLDRPAPTALASLRNVIARVRDLRATLRREAPDVVISATDRTNVLALLATRGLGIPVIANVVTVPVDNGPALQNLCRLLYPRAAALVSVSPGVEAEYAYVPVHKRHTIAYPVRDVAALDAVPPEYLDPARQHIVTLGRLSVEKGHPLLVDAFAQVAAEFPQWDVTLFGEGDLRADLEAQVAQLGLTGRVHLPGRIDKPYAALKAADIYVQPSKREGFSNAVLEALACGLPVVATDYAGDPRAAIDEGENGLIVPVGDASALAGALRRLMQSPEERSRMGQNALAVRATYTPESIVAQWEAVINAVLAAYPRR